MALPCRTDVAHPTVHLTLRRAFNTPTSHPTLKVPARMVAVPAHDGLALITQISPVEMPSSE